MAFIEHPLIQENKMEEREFQSSLAKSALEKGNSLIVVPTAMGKTIIALRVIAETLFKKRGKILFLAPTKPLVLQHSKTLKKLLKIDPEQIAVITGIVKPVERKKIFKEATVICSTPQCVRNDLDLLRISLSEFGLVVFDEAHRAIGLYAYVSIAQRFSTQNPSGLILAMTASPGHQKKKIKEIAKNLFVDNFEIRTRKDEDVKDYVNEIEIGWVPVPLPESYEKTVMLLRSYIKKILSELKRMGQINSDNIEYFSRKRILQLQIRVSAKISAYGKKMPLLYGVASKIACILMANHALLLIETQGAKALNDYLEKKLRESKEEKSSRALKMFVKNERVKNCIVESRKLVSEGEIHSKLKELKKIIFRQLKENPDSRILVFNHFRDSVAFVSDQLSAIKNVRVQPFVGQASKGKLKGMSQQEQAETVKQFETGKFNVLVATSVAEEGLDIPACDLVVFYEPVPSEIRHIQRRGRTGRIKKGKAIILMASETRDEAFYWSAKRKEGKMQEVLKKMQSNKPEKQKTLGEFK